MKVVRTLTSFGLAVAALCAVSLGSDSVSVLDVDDVQTVRAGQTVFSRECFQNVSDCISCTSNSTSCTLSGDRDACVYTEPSTTCTIDFDPPTCGFVILWSLPGCNGLSFINPNINCFEFICS